MSTIPARLLAVIAVFALVAAACGSGDDDQTGDDDRSGEAAVGETTAGETADAAGETAADDDNGGDTDYEALGLWDDGPCDGSLDPLVVGNLSPHESPVLSLIDHVVGLEAAAEAFNARGGANGACVEVVACDDQNDFDQALECVRELDDAGVVVTLNDAGQIAQAEVSAAFAEAGIPRVGGNVSNLDWDDQNAYPIGASGTAMTFLMPEAMLLEGTTDLGLVRVDLPAAGAMSSFFESLYGDDGVTFPVDVPVPAGTTDYTQFVLAVEDGNASGMVIALGEQEAVQVVRASQQLGSDLPIVASLGTFSYENVTEFGDTAEQMIFLWAFPPATVDEPVYQVLRGDLAASGQETMQPENLKTGTMMSWISLYALLRMIRDEGPSDLGRDAITSMLDDAEDVPMLGIFGDETWTPAFNYPGVWQRAGMDRWTYWKWDPEAEWNGNEGNFVLGGEISFSEVLCGSPFGAPEPC